MARGSRGVGEKRQSLLTGSRVRVRLRLCFSLLVMAEWHPFIPSLLTGLTRNISVLAPPSSYILERVSARSVSFAGL